ncbi:hypothetical protein B296_00044784 [Ensete ventricosum]|uniref:UBC core domain-containing protein n=1 Tax=Ensete ventricosum TaxID=4639 RepID=A0A426XAK2_ENSVE|nr:hypothetical protein B296_00044784 [Ensete ventricosum]
MCEYSLFLIALWYDPECEKEVKRFAVNFAAAADCLWFSHSRHVSYLVLVALRSFRLQEISLSTSHRPASLSNPPKDLFFDILPFLVSFLLHADPDSLALFSSNRLQSELMSLMMCEEPGISAFPEGDNIFCWKGTIHGSKDTAYEGMVYKLSFAFPADYPMKPPKVKFETACFHPNVDVYGNICLDILQVRGRWKSPMFFFMQFCIDFDGFFLDHQDKWSSAYDVRTILLSIQSLLGGKHERALMGYTHESYSIRM